MSEDTPQKSQWIVETDADTFERDVFERSQETPVLVDFWAAWCQPCRMLAPVLEKLAVELDGEFVLVKAETDRVPQAAEEFGVSSIPVVYAVVGGEVVDFFQGAMPEPQIRSFLDRVKALTRVHSARQLEAEQPAEAEAIYRQILEESPNQPDLQVDLARALVAQEKFDEAGAIIGELDRLGMMDSEAEKIKAKLDLHKWEGADLDEIRGQVEANPKDMELQLKLGEALAAHEQFQEALEVCLKIVQQEKQQGVGDQARQVMVDVFRLLSDDDAGEEMVREYRRKLSTALY